MLGTYFSATNGLWEDSLTSLIPVPEDRLLKDNLLRSAAGTPDMRYQMVLHSSSLESLLIENESVDLLLHQAVQDGLLESWQSVSLILPSLSTQTQRRISIPESGILGSRLDKAISQTPFRKDAFRPFQENARLAKDLPPLLPEQFEATELASWLDAHLIQAGNQWVSLISMSKPKPEELSLRLKSWEPRVQLIDLQQSSLDLMQGYRNGATRTVLLASLLIIVLLLFEQKEPRKVLWIVLTVMASLAVTIYGVISLHAGLTIIHLVALLLVAGLGLDYALFFSRTETEVEQTSTRHAVTACAVSTTLTFGILSMSSIPVLKFIGLTVAMGSASSFLLTFAGSWIANRQLNQGGS